MRVRFPSPAPSAPAAGQGRFRRSGVCVEVDAVSSVVPLTCPFGAGRFASTRAEIAAAMARSRTPSKRRQSRRDEARLARRLRRRRPGLCPVVHSRSARQTPRHCWQPITIRAMKTASAPAATAAHTMISSTGGRTTCTTLGRAAAPPRAAAGVRERPVRSRPTRLRDAEVPSGHTGRRPRRSSFVVPGLPWCR